jgi:hypothetical protein
MSSLITSGNQSLKLEMSVTTNLACSSPAEAITHRNREINLHHRIVAIRIDHEIFCLGRAINPEALVWPSAHETSN